MKSTLLLVRTALIVLVFALVAPDIRAGSSENSAVGVER